MNLDAVRDALLADARTEAASLLAEADRENREQLAAARAELSREVEHARVEGERDAAEGLARQRARARREARGIVLAARRRAHDELRERAHAAVGDLVGARDYAELIERLRALAVAQLGSGADVTLDPNGEPGLVAEADGRRVDYRLVALADRIIDSLGTEVAQLWS